MFILNLDSPVPLYLQLVEQAERLILSGQLKAGDSLPSVREMAEIHSINPMTISKAYSLLEAQGLLVRQRGKPMKVSAKISQQAKSKKMHHIKEQLEQLVIASKQLGLEYDDVVAALKKYF